MTDAVSRRAKGPPAETDLSQVMAHGPALCEAYGKFWATIIMLFAIAKARRGPVGIATLATVAAGVAYHVLWK